MPWKTHIEIIAEHIEALENEGHLGGSPPAFLGHMKLLEGLEEIQKALKDKDFMKGQKNGLDNKTHHRTICDSGCTLHGGPADRSLDTDAQGRCSGGEGRWDSEDDSEGLWT